MPEYPRMITGDYPCCPGCGVRLEDYEIFACRLRGLKRPVCIGCLANVLVFLRDQLLPLHSALQRELADVVEKGGPTRASG